MNAVVQGAPLLAEALGISESTLLAALAARAPGENAARVLSRLKLASEATIAAALAKASGLPLLDAEDFTAPTPTLSNLRVGFLEAADAAIAQANESGVVLALADPQHIEAAAGVRLAAGAPVRVGVASVALIDAARAGCADARQAAAIAAELADLGDEPDTAEAANRTPIVQLVDELIAGAIRARASDLHMEPYPDRLRTRVRIDGVLQDGREVSPRVARTVAARVKILAGMDVAERRLPQDGRLEVAVNGRRYDVRVASSVTAYGETLVLRFLSAEDADVRLDGLGFTPDDLARVYAALAEPSGLIVIVGPTGAGKTTTLAAMLRHVHRPERKVVSIEDPVEYRFDGATQIAVRPAIGLSFAAALRASLRSDPDIIVVGEMRDAETATVAANAALTGHLVLATVHANDAAAAAPRLLDLGVRSGLLRSTLRLAVAQRLLRRLCGVCLGKGCTHCDQLGYRGRVGVFEMLEFDATLSRLIKPDCVAADFTELLRAKGVADMADAAVRKIQEGVTSPSEARRALGPNHGAF